MHGIWHRGNSSDEDICSSLEKLFRWSWIIGEHLRTEPQSDDVNHRWKWETLRRRHVRKFIGESWGMHSIRWWNRFCRIPFQTNKQHRILAWRALHQLWISFIWERFLHSKSKYLNASWVSLPHPRFYVLHLLDILSIHSTVPRAYHTQNPWVPPYRLAILLSRASLRSHCFLFHLRELALNEILQALLKQNHLTNFINLNLFQQQKHMTFVYILCFPSMRVPSIIINTWTHCSVISFLSFSSERP